MNFPFDEEIILEDDIVLLRPLKDTDVSLLLPVASADEKLVQFSPGKIHTPELLTTYVQRAIADRKSRTRYAFIIYDKRKNAYAGSTSFMAIVDPDSRLEIGATWIGKDFQRTGLNRDCKFLLLRYCFDTLGAMRVELKTDERNKQSRTAIEGIGAKQEGILRSHMLMADGHRRNTVYYSILKDEWELLKKDFLTN
jgi:N-acetyltransferase